MATFLASFPNSRIENRPATTSEATTQVSLPASGSVETVVAENINRTGLTLRNTSFEDNALYAFPNADGSIPTAAQIQASGKLLAAREQTYVDTNQAVYALNATGNAVLVIDVDEGSG